MLHVRPRTNVTVTDKDRTDIKATNKSKEGCNGNRYETRTDIKVTDKTKDKCNGYR